jgi:hypothetical protein
VTGGTGELDEEVRAHGDVRIARVGAFFSAAAARERYK